MTDDRWLGWLADAIQHKQHEAALGPLAPSDALDEMIQWLSDRRPFAKQHAQAWRSAARDLEASISQSGERLQGLASQRMNSLDIDRTIRRAQAGMDLTAELSLLRTAYVTITSSLGLRAAWFDLVKAAKEMPHASLLDSLHILVRLAASRGLDLGSQSRILSGVLQNDQSYITAAYRSIGFSRTIGAEEPDSVGNNSDMTTEERLDLCARIICAQPPQSHYIVWLGVSRARLPFSSLQVGNDFTFYDSRYIEHSLSQNPKNRSNKLPVEIQETTSPFFTLPTGDHVLLVRVDMGNRAGSFVEDEARKRLLALLAPADRVDSDDWSILRGSVTFQDGLAVGWSTFHIPEEVENPHQLDIVVDGWLNHQAAAIADAYPAPSSSSLGRLIRLTTWDAAHRETDSLTMILLAIRTIETVSQSELIGMDWQNLLRRYHVHFAWEHLRSELAAIARQTLYSYEYNTDPAHHTRLRLIFLDVTVHSGVSSSMDLRKFIGHLQELCDLWNPEPHEARVRMGPPVRADTLHECYNVWTSKSLFETKLAATETKLERRTQRLARLRNAAQHGGPIPEPSIDSVTAWADLARRRILAEMLHGLINGRSCQDTLDLSNDFARRRQDRLTEAGSPVEALAIKLLEH